MKIWNQFIKPVVVLVVICIVTSALLGLTNEVTAPVIEKNAAATANAARTALLPEAKGGFTEQKTEVEGVTELYVADNGAGCVITAEAQGYGGPVPVMVAFDAQSKIVAVNFLANSETPGLGQKVRTAKFGGQFAGMDAVSFGLSDIDAVSGATISSSAAVTALNAAITAYNEVMGVEQVDLAALSEEEVQAYVMPESGALTQVDIPGADEVSAYTAANGGIIITAEGSGFYKKPLIAVVGFDANGAMTGAWFNAENETQGVGKQVGTSVPFSEQFKGKADTEGVDVVAGASVSSGSAIEAVKTAITYFTAAKEAGLV